MDLRSFLPAELKERAVALGESAYRGEQVFRWLHGASAAGQGAVQNIDAPTNFPVKLRESLLAESPLQPLAIDVTQEAADGTRKFRFRTHDGHPVEAVLIPSPDAGEEDDNDRLTLCVSSQVGCALDCQFCATGTLGLTRSLTAGEIVEQVYWAATIGGRRPTNLVFMGMGEPLHNYDNVVRAFSLLMHPWGTHFSPRRITVSTVGLVTGIDKLAALDPAPNLAISLNATTDEVRDELMPVNRRWSIDELIAAARRFPLAHNRSVTFEYVMLAGVNDTDEDAERLPRLLKGFPAKVNLIPWNAFSGPQFKRPSNERIFSFQEIVRRGGIPVYIRMPRGDDIDAACGQLAARAPGPRGFVDVSLRQLLRTPRSA